MKQLFRRTALATFAAAISATTVGLHGGNDSAVTLKVDGRGNANVSLAARGQFVSVVWVAVADGGVTDIYAATSRDAGNTFTPRVRVNDIPGDAHVSGEQPPRVALIPRPEREPQIVILWTSSHKDGTRLLTARSDDGGRTFAHAAVVPGSDATGNRGWESLAVNAVGHVDVMWLDHRGMAQASAGAENHHEHGASDRATHDGVAMAQKSQLFFATLDSPGTAHAVTKGVCYCCKTAMATASDGSIYLAWRHVYPGNIRDIALTLSHDGGRTFADPVRVSDDRWVLDGCPENGPAVAVEGNRRIHVVWPTLLPGSTADAEPTLGLFYAMSRDGRHFTPRQQISTRGVARHAQIAINERGRILVAWDEQANETRHVAFARAAVDADGHIRTEREPFPDAERGVYPALAALPNGFIAAWASSSTDSGIRVLRIAEWEKGALLLVKPHRPDHGTNRLNCDGVTMPEPWSGVSTREFVHQGV